MLKAPTPGLSIEIAALEQLAELLLERVGLKITPDGYYGLKLAMQARMPALGISDGDEYVRRLKQLAGEHELRSLLPLVTVGKTDFFRDPKQFRALEVKLLPKLLETARGEGRKGLVWSAGCATGEEPYSLAMVAMELGASTDEIDIWATDLNPAAVETARAGKFPKRRMAGVSEERLKRFFNRTDDIFQVMPALQKYVRFDGQNLAAPVFPKVIPRSLDIILCRNVIIYFDLPTIRGLMDRFLDALRPGGTLLLGYSESLYKVYDKFEMYEVEGTFAYRRPLPGAPMVPHGTAAPAEPSAPVAPSGPGSKSQDVTAVARPPRERTPTGSKRKPAVPGAEETTQVSKTPGPFDTKKAPSIYDSGSIKRNPVERLESVVWKMNAGDFQGALNSCIRLVNEEDNDLAAMLTLGNIYSLMGKNSEARGLFSEILAKEPFCVEARIFGGVAALQAGQLEDARNELTRALFLEPSVALGHYLLAQVYERLGNIEQARRAYRNTIEQLRHTQRPLAGHYPDMPESDDAITRAAKYALAALEETEPHMFGKPGLK